MGFDDICHPGLVLGLGFPSSSPAPADQPPALSAISNKNDHNKKPCNYSSLNFEPLSGMATAATSNFEPLLTLGLSGEMNNGFQVPRKIDVNKGCEDSGDLYRQASPHSAVSSFSNASVKRERDLGSEELEVEKVSSRISDEDEDGTNARKKLRLTKEQSALLEESFKQHSTLNPKQKQALARELNLRPRQVEVWFQNRRARTKLKQTEVDCEFLKKCCETLTDENRRLQKELQELKALKLAQPFYMQLPAATLTMCPSCERIGGAVADNPSKTPFGMAPKPHFFNPFSNPSAACS
ncbi:homeobox-leucine zipper protein HAT22-like [Malania oleifera]|uniref:homeobox-leucine zipper protein HAT22-like n=1 Tax=Malania oleifera TaxID=397392 RepID=UPI0025AEC789|nr:homeobox-leucine zipper protein HAT22-like [Malania oleifera]